MPSLLRTPILALQDEVHISILFRQFGERVIQLIEPYPRRVDADRSGDNDPPDDIFRGRSDWFVAKALKRTLSRRSMVAGSFGMWPQSARGYRYGLDSEQIGILRGSGLALAAVGTGYAWLPARWFGLSDAMDGRPDRVRPESRFAPVRVAGLI